MNFQNGGGPWHVLAVLPARVSHRSRRFCRDGNLRDRHSRELNVQGTGGAKGQGTYCLAALACLPM